MNSNFEEMVARLSPTIRRITYKLNGHFTYFDDDDLFQEALEHLWVAFQNGTLAEKTDSYVLQGCYFHLKNHIRRMMDRVKLASLNAIIDDDDTALEDFLACSDPGFEEARMASLINDPRAMTSLTGREKKVVKLSLDGMTVREIGQKLGISHVMVVKMRRRIKKKCNFLNNNLSGGYQN